MPAATPDLASAPRALGVGVVAWLICFACMALYLYPLLCPELVQDDFQILVRGATWRRTIDNLWVPQNEHAMPLGRLLTYILMRIGGRATLLPWTAGLVGPVALLAALPLVYLLVRRERSQPFYGLLAAALFGVTSVYQQAVYWFAASFSVLALDTMLLALLAAQRWRQTGRSRWLVLSALACGLAPGWFASGVLAGPLCALYLLRATCDVRRAACGVRRAACEDIQQSHVARCTAHVARFVPLLGTALFLAVSLPLTAAYIRRLEHYQGRPFLEAFNPMVGLGYTARSIVDNLLLGVVGVSTVTTPIPLAIVLLLLMAGAAVWWWRQAPERRLLLLGLGMIGSGYLLVYSARSAWGYEQMTQPSWSRYHLLPQLGLALFVAGGRFTLRAQLPLLIVVLFLVQLPRALLGYFVPLPGIERFARGDDERQQLIQARETHEAQRPALQRVAEMEERCRIHGIPPSVAVEALPPLPMPGWGTPDANGWLLLRGQDAPCPLAPDEVRRLLEAP